MGDSAGGGFGDGTSGGRRILGMTGMGGGLGKTSLAAGGTAGAERRTG